MEEIKFEGAFTHDIREAINRNFAKALASDNAAIQALVPIADTGSADAPDVAVLLNAVIAALKG